MQTTTAGSIPVDQQICFALYSASRSLTALYRDLLAPLGITYPQYLVMQLLWQGEPRTVGALGERLELDSGTVSPLLRRLERAGLLERRRSGIDERTVLVHLTDAGRALREQAADIPERLCAATGLELTDIAALREQVSRLNRNVRGSLDLASR
ncbi:MarR family transcriptional regulator [Herbiconiux sp.]|uniref:MarR family winged helix-turn-helix transcriptional regulator n=1 Tax=Herbiconiux sp. TaxID=1871186 RepID=UPI0025C17AAA|nr:MarR family transcriptional regulator [Herbiconiux sp.]